MGFYTTDERAAVLEPCQENLTPPSKNRVWVFLTASETCAGFFESQPVESHWEKLPTPTKPVSGMRFYGYRLYIPELGRWASRDPIGEEGGENIYLFVNNSAANHVDALGNVISSFEVKGGQGEAGWWDAAYGGNRWFRSIEEPYKNALSGPNVGFQMGKESAFAIWPFTSYSAVGGWKFEEKALWCGRTLPEFKNYASNVQIIRHKYSDSSNVSSNRIATFRDGPTGEEVRNGSDALGEGGAYVALAMDAPRTMWSYNSPKKNRLYLTGDWLLTVEDSRSRWEAKIHISFAFDDDLNPSTQVGHFVIISPPRRVR